MRRVNILALAVAAACLVASASLPAKTFSCPQDAALVLVVSAKGKHCFGVEIADTAAERARGLMYVRHLDQNRGMLFLFEHARIQAFWMKDTYIPLDIIFIGPEGRIVSIASRTEPLSERSIYSPSPVLAVLEINGGLSQKLGIRPGDLVRHAALGTAGTGREGGAQ